MTPLVWSNFGHNVFFLLQLNYRNSAFHESLSCSIDTTEKVHFHCMEKSTKGRASCMCKSKKLKNNAGRNCHLKSNKSVRPSSQKFSHAQKFIVCWLFTSFSSSTTKLLESLSFCSSTIKVTPPYRKLPLQTIHNSVLSVIHLHSDENPADRPFGCLKILLLGLFWTHGILRKFYISNISVCMNSVCSISLKLYTKKCMVGESCISAINLCYIGTFLQNVGAFP